MRNRKVAVLLLCSLIVLAGCDDKLLKVAQAAKDFSAATSALQDAEIQAHETRLIDDEAHVDIQRILLDVAHSGKVLDNAVNVAHSQPQAIAALQLSVDSLDNLLNAGVIKIKDPKTKTELSLAIISAKGILDSIAAVVGGGK